MKQSSMAFLNELMYDFQKKKWIDQGLPENYGAEISCS